MPADVAEMLRAVAQFGHQVSDTIMQGGATSHMLAVEQADCEYREGDALWFVGVFELNVPAAVRILRSAQQEVWS